MIRNATIEDAAEVARIYNHYVDHSYATFDESHLSANDFAKQIAEVDFGWLVKEEDGIQGYAYARQWKDRAAYRHSVETTVYLDPKGTGKGIGTQLYQALLDQLKAMDVHCALAGIALPNEASVKLHEKFGFQKVAHFRQTGWKFERWIDVGYWQLMF